MAPPWGHLPLAGDMPLRTASTLTFFYALGYPIGALAVSVMSPMAVLVFRFGLAAAILGGWWLLAGVAWPSGRTLAHVLISGLLAQGLLFTCLYLALLHGAAGGAGRCGDLHEPGGDCVAGGRVSPVRG